MNNMRDNNLDIIEGVEISELSKIPMLFIGKTF